MKEGWSKRKLGDCLSYIKNGANIKQDREATGIPITRIETLANDVFNRNRLGYANIFSSEKYEQYILDSGDLLLSHINSKQYIGRTVVYRKIGDEQIIHGMNLLRMKVIPELLNPFFIYYCFKSHDIKEQIASHRKDAVNQSSISITDLKKVNIPVPSLSEQQHIVSELDCLNGIIEKKKEQLKQLDELAQSVFYDMFGDPVENEKGWEVKKLEEICKILGGGTPSKSKEEYWDGNIPWISSKDMKSMFLEKSQLYITKEGLDNSSAKLIPRGAIVMVIRSGILKHTLPIAIAKVDLTINQDLKAFIPNDELCNSYLMFCLKAYSPFLLSQVRAVTADNIEFGIIKNLEVPLPPIELQQQFASKITAIEQQKKLIKQSLTETETLFNSRMDYYFG